MSEITDKKSHKTIYNIIKDMPIGKLKYLSYSHKGIIKVRFPIYKFQK